jgi:hypothetical protein
MARVLFVCGRGQGLGRKNVKKSVFFTFCRFWGIAPSTGQIADSRASTLKDEKITFYSGRHFWKTVMNAGNLGKEAEEWFMGHKVTRDVEKRYCHKDKQGKSVMLNKAKIICDILDQYLFGAE